MTIETASFPGTFEDRDRDWCRRRLAEFDRPALRRAVVATYDQLRTALRDGQDAGLALMQHVLAMRLEVAGYKEAASHCAKLGVEPQSVLGFNPVSHATAYALRDHNGRQQQVSDSELAAAILGAAISDVTTEILQQHDAELMGERTKHASDNGRLERNRRPAETADQRRARRQEEYREELRKNGVDPDAMLNGVNVEGMTELERQRIGLPPGKAPRGGYHA